MGRGETVHNQPAEPGSGESNNGLNSCESSYNGRLNSCESSYGQSPD